MKIEQQFHIYCAHCGNEMPIMMDKTVGIKEIPNNFHWLVSPCLCQFDNKDILREQGWPRHED